jgi:hypothetical protein
LDYPPINGAGWSFPANLPDIMTAQQQDPVITGYLLNNPEKFEVQNYGGNKLPVVVQGPMDDGRLFLIMSLSI